MNVIEKLKTRTKEKGYERIKLVIFGGDGSGKSHFCCSIPNTLYIDTEGLCEYKKFVNMVESNGGDMLSTIDFDEIIDTIKYLIENDTKYKTVVIDSLSNILKFSSELEAERLSNISKKKGDKDVEGTEFGRNKNKPTRKIFYLCNLLLKLDMNVIVTSWPKPVYVGDKVIGNEHDVGKEVAHLLGTRIEAQKRGSLIPKAVIHKSRYEELNQETTIDLSYETFKFLFGEEIFERKSINKKLASEEQVKELFKLINALKIDEEITNKWLMKAKCSTFSEMEEEIIQKCIDSLKLKIS